MPDAPHLYLRARHWRDRALGTAAAVFDGVALGLLDREALARVDEVYYDDKIGRYVDDSYNRSGLAHWEQRLVDTYLPGGGTVAVTGAGAGREVLAMLEQGYDVHGYEPHPGLVEAANRLLVEAGWGRRVSISARDAFPADGSDQLRGVLVGWGSYMLIPGRRRRVEFLRGARARLAPGGHLLLSFFVRGSDTVYFRIVHRVGARLRRIRGAEPLDIGDGLVPNYAHHFTQAELREELAEAGFELLEYEREPYGHAAARAV